MVSEILSMPIGFSQCQTSFVHCGDEFSVTLCPVYACVHVFYGGTSTNFTKLNVFGNSFLQLVRGNETIIFNVLFLRTVYNLFDLKKSNEIAAGCCNSLSFFSGFLMVLVYFKKI